MRAFSSVLLHPVIWDPNLYVIITMHTYTSWPHRILLTKYVLQVGNVRRQTLFFTIQSKFLTDFVENRREVPDLWQFLNDIEASEDCNWLRIKTFAFCIHGDPSQFSYTIKMYPSAVYRPNKGTLKNHSACLWDLHRKCVFDIFLIFHSWARNW